MWFLSIIFVCLTAFGNPDQPIPDDIWTFEEQLNIQSQVYLPIVQSMSVEFGVEVETSFYSANEYVIDGGIVKTTIDWYKVEIRPDIFDWTEYDRRMAVLEGHPLILTIRNAPYFYRLWSGYVCSPPEEQYYSNYRDFVSLVIDRYDPYAVEIWNEPDVDRIRPDIWYHGCWLELGGEEYGKFLAGTYRTVNSEHPETLVIGGMFMLNSEEQREYAVDVIEKVGRYVDAWAYHSYPYYHRTETDSWNQPFERAKWLRKYTNKPLWLTETSLLCKNEWNICDDMFEELKAGYLQFVHKYAIGYSISTVVWFDMKNSWMHCSLIDPTNNVPFPAYDKYELLASK